LVGSEHLLSWVSELSDKLPKEANEVNFSLSTNFLKQV